jgi:hypothetical protein
MATSPGNPLRALKPAMEGAALHPSWKAFMEFCREMKHGEIERLMIQDGLPVLALTTRKKVKFT